MSSHLETIDNYCWWVWMFEDLESMVLKATGSQGLWVWGYKGLILYGIQYWIIWGEFCSPVSVLQFLMAFCQLLCVLCIKHCILLLSWSHSMAGDALFVPGWVWHSCSADLTPWQGMISPCPGECGRPAQLISLHGRGCSLHVSGECNNVLN